MHTTISLHTSFCTAGPSNAPGGRLVLHGAHAKIWGANASQPFSAALHFGRRSPGSCVSCRAAGGRICHRLHCLDVLLLRAGV